MAKYKAYPEYKDSGVEWLGDTPQSWDVSRLKHVASIYGRIGFRGYTVDDIVGEGEGAIVLSPSNIVDEKFSLEKKTFLRWEKYFESPEIIVSENDILLVKTGSTYGKSTIIKTLSEPMTINPQMALIKKIVVEPRFLAYWFNTSLIKSKIGIVNTGSGMPTMTQENINNFPVLIPPTRHDALIADFLDHETAKIDNLIEKQQQLIELLKEKRQAVISHAVTKGLNPDVPMKDSGVEWLGEVPEHWEVSKFGYISLVVRGGSPRPAGDPNLFNGDYSPWVTVAEITKDNEIYLDSTDTFLTKKGSEQCRVFKAGTLLLSNSGATLGVPKILNIDANANDGVVGFELLKIDHEYAYFYLSTLTTNLRESIKQGSGQPNLNTDIVKSIAIPIPPEKEIQQIVSFIKETIKLYSSIESGAMEQVKLLQERRTALISAAVTGKIDVRDWVAPEAQDLEEIPEATA